MVERALVLAIAAVGIAAAVVVARWWLGRGLAGLRTTSAEGLWKALGTAPDGRPSLVVFSTPSCTVCRTAQYPAVEAVAGRFGPALRILKVDLSTRPAVGRAFKVLTAPTTVVLRGDGRIASFNH